MKSKHTKSTHITLAGILLNTLLFIIKLIAGIISGSIALLADAFNSLTDILASTGIHLAVKISSKKADKGHPFGHHRYQPLAAFIAAVLMGILGLEVLSGGIKRLITPQSITTSTFVWIVIAATILIKTGMHLYFKKAAKEHKSQAIKATAIDSRNDAMITIGVATAIIGNTYGITWLDGAASIGISISIFLAAIELIKENSKYLTGAAAPKAVNEAVETIIENTKGVKGMHELKAHYVGDVIHLQVHIEVDKKISTQDSHDLEKKIRKKIENLEEIDQAFIHVDPR